MAGNQEVYLATVVFVIREALENLGARKLWKAVLSEGVDSLAVLEQADHVMYPNTRTFDGGVATAYAGGTDNVAVALGDGLHIQMVVGTSEAVNLLWWRAACAKAGNHSANRRSKRSRHLTSIGVNCFSRAAKSGRPMENVTKLERFVAVRSILLCDLKVSRLYGCVNQGLRSTVRPIHENDIWIAAIATCHELVLVTRDQHFRNVDGLNVTVWWRRSASTPATRTHHRTSVKM